MSRRALPRAGYFFVFAALAIAQAPPSGGLAVKLGLERLQSLGSVLMIAAHPDDENTALLSYFAQGRHYRTAYLSLTRGEGGQNLIGSEQGALMGVIRTQELLAARQLDGAEQYFTRAIDFGFSKTAEETLRKWGRDRVLADVVWTIRRYQPDVIFLRFSGTPRDGHGHHQSSAILGAEAFTAAADAARFPEQLQYVKPWQARRIFWNVFAFTPEMERQALQMTNKVTVDVGEYNAELGYSYGEIAGMSRSMHRSQGMGAAQRRGSQPQVLTLRAGEAATKDPFDNIDTTWARVPGGAPIGELLKQATAEFDLASPAKIVPRLLEARKLIAAIDHPWAKHKLNEIERVIAEAAGLWLDATTNRSAVPPGAKIRLTVTAVNRSAASVQLMDVRFSGMTGADQLSAEPVPLNDNKPFTRAFDFTIPGDQPVSQPFWLRTEPSETLYTIDNQRMIGPAEGEAILQAHFRLRFGEQIIEIARPVVFRYVDAVRGELTRPFIVVPPASVNFATRSLLFPTADARTVAVEVRANVANASIQLKPAVPAGWRIEPAAIDVSLAKEGEQVTRTFTVYPPATATTATLEFPGAHGIRAINYDHIPPQALFPPAVVTLVRADAKLLSRNIGYIMGAGDDVPQSLEQLGARVTLLSADDLARADLSRFDAIVTGVRAYNVRPDVRAAHKRLMEYANNGGTVVVQYNVLEGGFGGRTAVSFEVGPYPLKLSRDRVTVEDSPVNLVNADSPLLQAPNKITPADYDGWVQERGLYFASEWDPQYKTLWELADPKEKPTQGGTLYTRYGKGVYIFTPMSWFRQLPAGVPGAYRIFANFISASKVTQ